MQEGEDTQMEESKEVDFQELLQEQVSHVQGMNSTENSSGENSPAVHNQMSNAQPHSIRPPNQQCVSLCGRILRIMGDEQTCRTCGRHLKCMGDEIYMNYAARNMFTQLRNIFMREEQENMIL